jgi:hypothetical protein
MTDFDNEMPPATADGIPITQDPTTEFRYPDGRVKELVADGSFDHELFKFTPHGDEILVTEIPQCRRQPRRRIRPTAALPSRSGLNLE